LIALIYRVAATRGTLVICRTPDLIQQQSVRS
jgi:hypothetical protein